MASGIRQVLLHGSARDSFAESLQLARTLANTRGAVLHVLYTVEEPLSADWTAEIRPEQLVEVQQAIQAEAQQRIDAVIPLDEQDRMGIVLAIRTGSPADELVRYTEEQVIELTIVEAPVDDEKAGSIARALLDRGETDLLVLRGRRPGP